MKMKCQRDWFILNSCCVCIMFVQLVSAQTWSAAGPLPRGYHSAVLDTTTNKMVVFGGFPSPAVTNGTQNLNDLWRFNVIGKIWSQVMTKGAAPAPRFGHTAVYDSINNRMIVFGGAEGRSSPCENDIWILTNASGRSGGGTTAWTQLQVTGNAPAPRTLHGAVYDPNTNVMITYGGQDCFSTVFDDVWVLSNANGIGGTPSWTQLSTSGTQPPASEIGQSVAYDPSSNTLITFGNGRTNGVWVLSNANGQGGTPSWTQLSPSGTAPAARAANTLVYAAATNSITVFGGQDSTGAIFSDTWVLSNANGIGGTPVWAQIATGSQYFPEARNVHTAVYNSSTNQMTVFGGEINPYFDNPELFTNDVFVLSHANGH